MARGKVGKATAATASGIGVLVGVRTERFFFCQVQPSEAVVRAWGSNLHASFLGHEVSERDLCSRFPACVTLVIQPLNVAVSYFTSFTWLFPWERFSST